MVPQRDDDADTQGEYPDHVPDAMLSRYGSAAIDQVTWSRLAPRLEREMSWYPRARLWTIAAMHRWAAILLTIVVSTGMVALMAPVIVGAPTSVIVAGAAYGTSASLSAIPLARYCARVMCPTAHRVKQR